MTHDTCYHSTSGHHANAQKAMCNMENPLLATNSSTPFK